MIVLDTYKMELGELSETLSKANAQMKPQELQTELKELEDQMSAADFWNDIDNANKITQRVKILKDKLERLRRLNAQRDDIQTLIEMAEEEEDESLTAEIKSELADLQKRWRLCGWKCFLKGPMTAATPFFPCMQGQAAPKPRTGRIFFTACTPGTVTAGAGL